MKHLRLIAGFVLSIGFMSACTNGQATQPSQNVSVSEAEKNALEAEQAELELAKLAELQKQADAKATTRGGKKKGDRLPASAPAAPAPVVKVEKKAEKKVVEKKVVEKKASTKAATKKPEAPAPASPQQVAKQEIAAAKDPTNVAVVAALGSSQSAPQSAPAVKSQAAPRPASSKSSVYVVQVGSFKVKENALKLEEKLKGDGFPVRMREINHSKNGHLYVVQFEPTPNRDEADTWRSQVKAKSSLDAQLVSRPD